ncbi:MAG: RNA ligase family protein [Bacteroidota bacterium]
MKPLGHKAYGSIPHLPGSKRGPADKGLTAHQASILTHKPRRGDRILVSEKLDGSNVAVAKISGQIVPLLRAGYRAESSGQEQHAMFASYVMQNWETFDALLRDGERVCGEWLAMAHAIRYDLTGRTPFVAFDLMRGHDRAGYDTFRQRLRAAEPTVAIAPLLHDGKPIRTTEAMRLLGPGHYGAQDAPEGVVYRVERAGVPDFLGKYVRDDFQPGRFFAAAGEEPVWNWPPRPRAV